MYQLDDTIVAVSSPTSQNRVLVRISGPGAFDAVRDIFTPAPPAEAGIMLGMVTIDDELRVDAKLYLFFAPHS